MSKGSIDSKVLAIEMELSLAEQDFDSLSADLSYLRKLESTVSHNISFLKKEAKVVVALEYKRSCIELAHIISKIRSLGNQISQLEKTIQKKMLALDYYYKQYELQYELQSNKILVFRGRDVR
jgi:chromosome segregation ATPase